MHLQLYNSNFFEAIWFFPAAKPAGGGVLVTDVIAMLDLVIVAHYICLLYFEIEGSRVGV